MVIRFFKRLPDNTPEFIKDVEVKGCRVNGKDFYRTVEVSFQQVVRELVGEDGIMNDSGFAEIHSCEDFWSTFRKRDGVRPDSITRGMCSTTISGRQEEIGETHLDWPCRTAVIDGIETAIEVGCDVFDTGYLISSSAKATNLVGGKETVWFEKITPKWFKQGGRRSARLFKTEKDLLKFLKDPKNQLTFSMMHANKGTEFGFEPASSLWKHEIKADVKAEIEEIFYGINNYEDEPVVRTSTDIPDHSPEAEALFRMNDLNLYKPVVSDFARSRKLYMSEFGGIIYDLNDEAKEAVRRTSEYGLPYHVIRSNHPEIGDMYAVLFVSKHKEDWGMDAYNPRDKIVFANVYNASMGIDEMGSICVEPANGGLMRTA